MAAIQSRSFLALRWPTVGKPRQDLLDRAAQIDIDRLAGDGVENQDRRSLRRSSVCFGRAGDLGQIAGGDAAVTLEGDEGV